MQFFKLTSRRSSLTLFVLALLTACAVEIAVAAINTYLSFLYNLSLMRNLSVHDYAIATKHPNVWLVLVSWSLDIVRLLAIVGIGFLFGKKTRRK
jgi:hypothetical protein